MTARVAIRRGTRAALNSAAIAGQLVPFEPLLIMDEERMAVATSSATYSAMAKQNEAGGGGGTTYEFALAGLGGF